MDCIAPLDPSKDPKQWKENKPKPAKQKDKDAVWATVAIETQIEELIWMVNHGSESPASAAVALTSWCKEHGHSSFAVGKLFQEKLSLYKDASGYDDDEAAPQILKDYRKIEKVFGNDLRYNRLFRRVELKGQTFEPSMAKIEFIVDHNLKLKSGRDDIGDCVMKLAKQNEYHPVREYLETCYKTHGTSTKVLEGFANRYFGTSNPIHQTATIKFLVSAVARAYEPGCQVDSALILQGGQGVRKSTFFRVLASPDWFDDSFGNAGDKDERLKLHCAWILEWAELESIFRRKDMSAVKAFITTKIDRIRPPYGRAVEIMERSSVFCGTTNQTDFLCDSTGNRRFWVIPVGAEIDTTRLQKERDQIWAAATALYKSGAVWDLTREESAAMDEGRKEFEATDAWEDEVLNWLEGKEEISLQEILTDVLSIPLNQQDKRCQMRIRNILIRSNYDQKPNPTFYKGKRVRTWTKKESF
jgi:predicted P-loop ATPase